MFDMKFARVLQYIGKEKIKRKIIDKEEILSNLTIEDFRDAVEPEILFDWAKEFLNKNDEWTINKEIDDMIGIIENNSVFAKGTEDENEREQFYQANREIILYIDWLNKVRMESMKYSDRTLRNPLVCPYCGLKEAEAVSDNRYNAIYMYCNECNESYTVVYDDGLDIYDSDIIMTKVSNVLSICDIEDL